jgi:hypothetical protein
VSIALIVLWRFNEIRGLQLAVDDGDLRARLGRWPKADVCDTRVASAAASGVGKSKSVKRVQVRYECGGLLGIVQARKRHSRAWHDARWGLHEGQELIGRPGNARMLHGRRIDEARNRSSTATCDAEQIRPNHSMTVADRHVADGAIGLEDCSSLRCVLGERRRRGAQQSEYTRNGDQ